MRVLNKDIGRRLLLELQCSLYQGQQGDVSQSVRGNYKTRSRGRQNLTAVEGSASVYQVNPVSRTTSKERAECSKGWVYVENRTVDIAVVLYLKYDIYNIHQVPGIIAAAETSINTPDEIQTQTRPNLHPPFLRQCTRN